ncbi:hypothetical protein GCM10009712_40790 [Pseudarthrobacter sulfonivorans]|uniref:hypothetical protein n=1 Tax=Pseudarthrobacter sulfonivorans TaxID=121292 RepID=UPI00168B5189|nr:hypothetical protein [Pseudarthrobacter sulfonivorans]
MANAIVFNLLFFTSAGMGLASLLLHIPGIFAFGYWVGHRESGKTAGRYWGVSLSLGLLTWVIFLVGLGV